MNYPADTSICLGENVVLNAEATGGNGSFTYFWDDDPLPGTPSINVSPGTTTSYSVHVEDARGCPSTVQYFTIELPDPLGAQVIGPVDVCYGTTVQLEADVQGGLLPYVYQWTNSVSSATSSDPVWRFDALESAQYYLEITDACSEMVFDTLDLAVSPELIADFDAAPTQGCAPLLTFLEDRSVGNVTRVQWAFDGVINHQPELTEKEFLAVGPHTISYTVFDDIGCSATEEIPVEVFRNSVADFQISPEVGSLNFPEVVLTNLSRFADSLLWEIDSVGVFVNETPSVIMFPSEQEQEYLICLKTNNEFECPDSLCKTIWMRDDVRIYVPNSFTPNGDTHNETFLPIIATTKEILEYELRIFDRWGEQIFISYDENVGWDGVYKGEIVFNNVFAWTLRYRLQGEERKKDRGAVSIIR